jgi:4-hydroxy-3-methylbut-2-enyl diphosphate reductase
MGQFDDSNGGAIYLVEDPEQAQALVVNNPNSLSYVTQTTLSMDDTAKVVETLLARFPSLAAPRIDDICYATQNRQDAIKTLAGECDLVLVVGSPNSSNSNRLAELASRMGVEAHLIDSVADIDIHWLQGKASIGVSAGASAPEVLVQQVIKGLQALGAGVAEDILGEPEDVTFSMPKELRLVQL